MRLPPEATRDKKKFSLVFEENVNYGFRRNLWGMRPAGVLAACLGCVSAVGRFATDRSGAENLSPMVVASAVISAMLLSWWILRIRQNWVKIAAEAYAERLLAACEVLASSASGSKPSVE